MKKTIMSLCCALLGTFAVQAQTFIPPSFSFPEVTYPTGPMNAVSRTFHTSCNSYGNLNGDNLYVYSWSCTQPIAGGFAFRRNTTADVLISQGYQPYADVSDLEVGLIAVNSTVFIVASYYKVNTGHFVDFWTWNVAGGTISLYASYPLTTNAIYSRISLDVHKLYGAAVTWHDGNNDIFVKVFNTGGGFLQAGSTLQIASNGVIPDVAFSHYGDLKVRVAYVDPTSGNIRVIHGLFNDLLVGTVSIATDYVQTGIYPALGNQLNHNPVASNWMHIDSPDDNPPGSDVWSYVYAATSGDIMSISKYNASAPVLMNLSGNIKGQTPTIAYGADAQSIHYGWYTNFTATPQPGYVAVERRINGSYITPPNAYKVVANTTNYSGTPALCFSKQNDMNNNLFAVYPMFASPSGYEMRFKLVPWLATTFRHEVPVTGEPVIETVSASPNPFTSTLQLKGNLNHTYTLYVTDISGRVLYNRSGSLNELNAGLQEIAGPLKPGIYFLDILNQTTSLRQSLKAVKQ